MSLQSLVQFSNGKGFDELQHGRVICIGRFEHQQGTSFEAGYKAFILSVGIIYNCSTLYANFLAIAKN